MDDKGMTGNARSEMGKPMYEGPDGFTAVVTHAVELDGFPSQTRGPVLAVYCLDENSDIRVEPRWLTPAGVGVHRGPQFTTQNLRDCVDLGDLTWFIENEIDFERWRKLAIAHAP